MALDAAKRTIQFSAGSHFTFALGSTSVYEFSAEIGSDWPLPR